MYSWVHSHNILVMVNIYRLAFCVSALLRVGPHMTTKDIRDVEGQIGDGNMVWKACDGHLNVFFVG